jgi:hypothetical protein
MSNIWTLILASVLYRILPDAPEQLPALCCGLVPLFNSYGSSADDGDRITLRVTDLQSRGCYTAIRFWNPRIRWSAPAGVPQANSVL